MLSNKLLYKCIVSETLTYNVGASSFDYCIIGRNESLVVHFTIEECLLMGASPPRK